jgi:hypothetical protein
MALKKEKTIKGIKVDYWKIVDCNVKTGFVAIAPYINKESAQIRENMMEGRTSFNIDFPVEIENPLAYAYGKIKESKMETKIIEEAVSAQDAVIDPEGNIITPATEGKDVVTEQVETNWFADAEDI